MSDIVEFSLLIKSLQEERERNMKKQLEKSTSSQTGSTEWASCKDFNIEVGKQQIEAYIKTWEIQSYWVSSVNFVRTEQEEDCTIYLYQAFFMAPTSRHPIWDRIGVCFAVEVSKTESETPVEVRFIIESRKLIHTPGRTRFSEKWLTDIAETKGLLQRMMDLN